MKRARASVRLLAAGGVVALAVSSCSGDQAPAPNAPNATNATNATGGSGGALRMLRIGPVYSWDPQRMYAAADVQFASRVFARTLTTFPADTGRQDQARLVGDLATDTGTMSAGGRTWSFTMRGDATWQDGKPVTCADVKYGVSRSFARDQITAGPAHALLALAIPKNPDGSSTYAGPYKKTGQAAFDRAVVCVGQTITFRLDQVFTDFNQAVTFPAFGPVRADQDKGALSRYQVFSNGPYLLQGTWVQGRGGTFVRNPAWDGSKDPVRRAHPASIVYEDGLAPEAVVSRIAASKDDDAYAVTADPVPPALQPDLRSAGDVKDRLSNPLSATVDYLVPNLARPALANASVRKALSMATDRAAYVAALGGETAAEPTFSMLGKTLQAYAAAEPLGVGAGGDATKAKDLLASAKVPQPVTLTLAYRTGAIADKAMQALRQGWARAGFEVTVSGIEKDYFQTIASVAGSKDYDVMWSFAAPEWPSGGRVLGPLFDSRPNLTPTGSGQDYGRYADRTLEARLDAAAALADPTARESAWGVIDQDLVKNAVAIPLADLKLTFVHGAKVQGYRDNLLFAGVVDLATVSVR